MTTSAQTAFTIRAEYCARSGETAILYPTPTECDPTIGHPQESTNQITDRKATMIGLSPSSCRLLLLQGHPPAGPTVFVNAASVPTSPLAYLVVR
jgi:hypothetical protein